MLVRSKHFVYECGFTGMKQPVCSRVGSLSGTRKNGCFWRQPSFCKGTSFVMEPLFVSTSICTWTRPLADHFRRVPQEPTNMDPLLKGQITQISNKCHHFFVKDANESTFKGQKIKISNHFLTILSIAKHLLMV